MLKIQLALRIHSTTCAQWANLAETPCVDGLCTVCIPIAIENNKTPSGGLDGDSMVKPLSTPTVAPAGIRYTLQIVHNV
jgi:hypothetical protein